MAKHYIINEKTKTGKRVIELLNQAAKEDAKAVQNYSQDLFDRNNALGIGAPLTDDELEQLAVELEADEKVTLEEARKNILARIKKRNHERSYKKAS